MTNQRDDKSRKTLSQLLEIDELLKKRKKSTEQTMILNMNEVEFDDTGVAKPPKIQQFSDKTVTLDISELEFDATGQIDVQKIDLEKTETADIIALSEAEAEDTIEFVKKEQEVLDIESLLVEPESTDSLDESAILKESVEEVTTEIAGGDILGGDILDTVLNKPNFSDDSFIRQIDESLQQEFQKKQVVKPDLITPAELKMIQRDLNHSCSLIHHLLKMENREKADRVFEEVQKHFKGDRGVVELIEYLWKKQGK